MKEKKKHSYVIGAFVVGAAALSLSIVPMISTPASGHGTHPGKTARLKSCASRGDVRTARSVAGHTVSYALERFRLKGRVSRADLNRVQNEMYEFLKKELGSPSAVCTTYVSHGYEYFERTYGDRAKAVLIREADSKSSSRKFIKKFQGGGPPELEIKGPVVTGFPPLGGGKGGSAGETSEQDQGELTCEDDPNYCTDVSDAEFCELWGHVDEWKQYCQTTLGGLGDDSQGYTGEGTYVPTPEPPQLGAPAPSFESPSGEMQGDRPWWERLNLQPAPPRQENYPKPRN